MSGKPFGLTADVTAQAATQTPCGYADELAWRTHDRQHHPVPYALCERCADVRRVLLGLASLA